MMKTLEDFCLCRYSDGWCISIGGCVKECKWDYGIDKFQCEHFARKHPLYGYFYHARPQTILNSKGEIAYPDY